MKKYNLLFFLISIVVIAHFFYCVISKDFVVYNEIGQVNLEGLKKKWNDSCGRACSKKILYLGSINIIEKYLTIYMILFVFSLYIRNRSIIN